MLPDFGTFYAENIGNKPVRLFVSEECVTEILTADQKLFAINFVVGHDNQRMMGTVEYLGTKADALEIAKQLSSTGIYCQPRPDLAYTTLETNERVIPFRLYQEPEPLSQEASDRIQAAEAKRARKAAKRQVTQNNVPVLKGVT